jgi:hypothetical protein
MIRSGGRSGGIKMKRSRTLIFFLPQRNYWVILWQEGEDVLLGELSLFVR